MPGTRYQHAHAHAGVSVNAYEDALTDGHDHASRYSHKSRTLIDLHIDNTTFGSCDDVEFDAPTRRAWAEAAIQIYDLSTILTPCFSGNAQNLQRRSLRDRVSGGREEGKAQRRSLDMTEGAQRHAYDPYAPDALIESRPFDNSDNFARQGQFMHQRESISRLSWG